MDYRSSGFNHLGYELEKSDNFSLNVLSVIHMLILSSLSYYFWDRSKEVTQIFLGIFSFFFVCGFLYGLYEKMGTKESLLQGMRVGNFAVFFVYSIIIITSSH